MRALIATLIGSLALGSVVIDQPIHAALSPTQYMNADAERLYQDAVEAIAKNDWDTAKIELQHALKLAPQNALVHYDLAIAYSHTGQITLAKTELNKAFQLGLPAEQEQAAKQLKQQFTTQPPATEASTRADSMPVQREHHSIDEILEWIIDNTKVDLDASTETTYVHIESSVTKGSDACTLEIHTLWKGKGPAFGTSTKDRVTIVSTVVLLGTLVPSVGVGPVSGHSGGASVQLYTTNNEKSVKYVLKELSETNPQWQTVESMSEDAELYAPSEDKAKRLKNAFKDAIVLCGGKPSRAEKKDIY
jgi:hypothetical protein